MTKKENHVNKTPCTLFDECHLTATKICNGCNKPFCQAHIIKIIVEDDGSGIASAKITVKDTRSTWIAKNAEAEFATNSDESLATTYMRVLCLDCSEEFFSLAYEDFPDADNRLGVVSQKLRDIRLDIVHQVQMYGDEQNPSFVDSTDSHAMLSFRNALNNVAWSQVHHCYGPAEDTPFYLLSLLSKDSLERENALDKLYTSLCHQGSVYEASCAAIPFLILMLEMLSDEKKPPIITFLADLACNDIYIDLDTRELRLDFDHDSPTYDRYYWWSGRNFLREGNKFYSPQWMKQAHEQASEGLSTYLEMLQTSDRKVLLATFFLLSGFAESRERIIPAVEGYYSSTHDPVIQAGALFCLSSLLDSTASHWEHYRMLAEAGVDEAHPLLRFAAALSLAKYHPQNVSSRTIEALVDGLVNSEQLIALTRDLPWPRQIIHEEICAALSRLGLPYGLQGLSIALQRGAAIWPLLDTFRIAEALLDAAFFGGWVQNRFHGVLKVMTDLLEDTAEEIIDEDSSFPYGWGHIHISAVGDEYEPSDGDIVVQFSGYDEYASRALQDRYKQEGRNALTDAQRGALEAVLHCDVLWKNAKLKSNLPALYGLPIGKEKLEQFLAERSSS